MKKNKKTKIKVASLTNTIARKKIHIPLGSMNRKTGKNQPAYYKIYKKQRTLKFQGHCSLIFIETWSQF